MTTVFLIAAIVAGMVLAFLCGQWFERRRLPRSIDRALADVIENAAKRAR